LLDFDQKYCRQRGQTRIFDVPFAATRTTGKRTFLFGWHWWWCDGQKSLKSRSSRHAKRPKLNIKAAV
jgi:hypothetical protein